MTHRSNLVEFPPYIAGAQGPRPANALTQADAQALAGRARLDMRDDSRKLAANKRWLIYSEQYRTLIDDRIGQVMTDPETRAELRKFASLALNPGLDITKAVAVVYKQGVRRSVEDATDQEDRALQRVVAESMLDVHAPQWNQLAFLLGPICAIPVIRNGRVTWDTLLPHFYDAIRDPIDPMGTPVAVAWTISGDDILSQNDKITTVLDSVSWRYFEDRGTGLELIDEVEHGLGIFPGSIFRLDTPYDADWWGSGRNERLVDGTIDVGVVNAALNYVRKSQNHKLLTIIGDLRGMPRGQKIDPEATVNANTTQGPNSLDISAIDFETSPDGFIRHIRFIYESLVEAHGIPAAAVTFDGNNVSDGERLRVEQEGLTELRNEQIPFARAFEHDLMIKTNRMMRRFRHPLAADMPTEDKLIAAYRVDFPKLARSFNDPAAEMEWAKFEIKMGWASQLDGLRRRHPGMPDSELIKMRDRLLEEQADFNDAVTTRNLNLDPDGLAETTAQAFGRTGPMVRDNPETPEGDNGGSRDDDD